MHWHSDMAPAGVWLPNAGLAFAQINTSCPRVPTMMENWKVLDLSQQDIWTVFYLSHEGYSNQGLCVSLGKNQSYACFTGSNLVEKRRLSLHDLQFLLGWMLSIKWVFNWCKFFCTATEHLRKPRSASWSFAWGKLGVLCPLALTNRTHRWHHSLSSLTWNA